MAFRALSQRAAKQGSQAALVHDLENHPCRQRLSSDAMLPCPQPLWLACAEIVVHTFRAAGLGCGAVRHARVGCLPARECPPPPHQTALFLDIATGEGKVVRSPHRLAPLLCRSCVRWESGRAEIKDAGRDKTGYWLGFEITSSSNFISTSRTLQRLDDR